MAGRAVTFHLHVFCDDQSTRTQSHRGLSVNVGHYVYDEPGSQSPWHESLTEGLWTIDSTTSRAAWDRFNGFKPSLEEFVKSQQAGGQEPDYEEFSRLHNEGFPPTSDVELLVGGAHDTQRPNQKLLLRCKLCGLDVQHRWGPDVWSVLDVLRVAGVSRISLRGLAARL